MQDYTEILTVMDMSDCSGLGERKGNQPVKTCTNIQKILLQNTVSEGRRLRGTTVKPGFISYIAIKTVFV